ncbi:MAG: transketolase, partial [Nitrospirota bacterium]
EGSVWEAADIARNFQLDNLCGIVDINRLGQSDPTMLEHDLTTYQARWEGFGWQTICVDGHNHTELLKAFAEAAQTRTKPTMILAKTLKGKGIPFAEDHPGWHGKPLNAQQAAEVITALNQTLPSPSPQLSIAPPIPVQRAKSAIRPLPAPKYGATDLVATREAFGEALAELGEVNSLVVALDADVKNSTYTDKFGKRFPDRFFENFIAEQNMVGTAAGLAACGKIPFAATFACFLTRAYDFIRMAAISQANIKLMGSHVGVSIGEDGPSQMGLEDLAMMAAQPGVVVLYPSDAMCAYRLVETMANHQGMVYMRTGRPKTPILYRADESFTIGGSKVLRQSGKDQLTIVAAGVTVFEALKAYDELQAAGIAVRIIDLYCVTPIDSATLLQAAKATNSRFLTVEDHYLHGGIGDAVLSAMAEAGIRLTKMGIPKIPHSGKPDQLLDHYGISARAIVEKVKQLI